MYAREAGSSLPALGVVPRHGALLLHTSVLGEQGHGVPGLRVVFSVRGERRVGTPCGAGCYRATIPLSPRRADAGSSRRNRQRSRSLPFWVGVSNAHVLGVTASGRAAWLVSFFDPGTPAWFEATVEKRTGHTLALRMFAAAHFMTDVYRSFDSAKPIVPPR